MTQSNAMTPYSAMAVVYDALIEDVDYGAWANNWQTLVKSHYQASGQVSFTGLTLLEVGAGTGNMTQELLKTGMRITAIDPSEAMLSVLQEKLFNQMGKTRLFHGTLDAFDTVETFHIAAGFLDVLNYVSPADLEAFFSRLWELVKPGGLATFDISTPYKLENLLGQQTFAENHEEFAFIWENKFNRARHWLDFEFALFSETEEGVFERHVEKHRQFAHTYRTIVEVAEKVGFQLKFVLDDSFTALALLKDAKSESTRWHFWFQR